MVIAPRHAVARLASLLVIGAILAAADCSGDRIVTPDDGDVALPPSPPGSLSPGGASTLGAPVPIDFDTYDRSHQVVHPSAVRFDSDWHGHRYWLALTPYPNSDDQLENPSLFASEDGDSWTVPDGLSNPLAKPERGYLSDPDLVYAPDEDELRLYYRNVVEKHRPHHRSPAHEADIVYVTRSRDGTHWSASAAVVRAAGKYVVSPSVARRPSGDWMMWAVDAGHRGCSSRTPRIVVRRSSDGLSWSPTREVTFSQPGYLPWHIDVQWVPSLGTYWALVAAYPLHRSCTATSLFLATSPDGVQWTTYPSPVLARGALPEFATNVYRSTFAIDPEGQRLTIWLSGASTVQRRTRRKPPVLQWRAAVWHTQVTALLGHVRASRARPIAVDDEPSFRALPIGTHSAP